MRDGPPPRIGVVTGEEAPTLTADGKALLAELRTRGWAAEPVLWKDSQAEWEAFDALLVRSCWEYHTNPDAFRDWVDRIENTGVVLLNSPDVIRWNLHKYYLRELAEKDVSILPTVFIERQTTPDLRTVLRNNDWREAVVKPAIGTSSAGVWRTTLGEAPNHQQRFEALVASGDVLVQQFAPEISDGELSLVFFEGRFSHATIQRPSTGDFRAHPEYGGMTEPYAPSREIVAQASTVLETASGEIDRSPTDLAYARVDGIVREDTFLLMELELIEPYLNLDAGGDAVARFADAIESRLSRLGTAPPDVTQPPQHSTNR